MERRPLHAVWHSCLRAAAADHPSERATYTNVPGRPGSLTTLEGEDVYEDVVLTAQCFLSDPTKIPAIAAWLKGSGKVRFANRRAGFYYARIANQISFEKILRGNPHRSFCRQFPLQAVLVSGECAGGDIDRFDQYNQQSRQRVFRAVITVYGTGDIHAHGRHDHCGTGRYFRSVTLIQNCWKPIRRDGHDQRLSGEFPLLKPGMNAISWTGEVSKVEIQPRWRYL